MGASFRFDPEKEEKHFLVYEKGRESLWLDFEEKFRYENKSGYGRLITQDGIQLAAQVNNKFAIYFDAYRFIQSYNENYTEVPREYKGAFLAHQDEGIEYVNFDDSRSYIRYRSDYGNFEWSNFPLIWGNSSNTMTLSDNTPSYSYLKWQRDFHKSSFTFIHGFIKATADWDLEEQSKKYIVGHRWDMAIWNQFNFSFSELLVYGNQDIEPSYLLPMVFLWSAQHNQDNSGNMMLNFEAEYFPVHGVKMYGALFLDELKVSELFNDWWANKHGLQAGIHLVPKNYSTDFRAEFTAIRPWSYTHRDGFNTFTHSGRGLGFVPGPNSQLFFFQNRWWFGIRHTLELSYSHLKHGEDPAGSEYPWGGDPNQNYELRNPDYDYATKWLMGEIVTTQSLSISWEYLLTNIMTLKATTSYQDIDGKSNWYNSLQMTFNY